MIKGHYFSKFLKLFLFGFGISCFTVVGNSVSAYQFNDLDFYKEVDLGEYYDVTLGEYSNVFSISPALNFTSQVNGVNFGNSLTIGKYSGITYAYRSIGWVDGKLYGMGFYNDSYHSDQRNEGFFTQICRIPTTDINGILAGCTENYNNFVDISNFYSDTSVWTKGYLFGNLYNVNSYLYWCFENSTYDYCVGTSASSYNPGLSGSLGYNNNTIEGIQSVPFGHSDFVGKGISLTDWTYCQPISQRMYVLEQQGYNTGLCYSNSYIMSGNSIVSKTPEFINDVFSSYSDYNTSVDKYYSYCVSPATPESCQSAFNGLDNQYEIIFKLARSNLDEKNLWNYCYLSTLDPNVTNCVLSGAGVNEPYTREDYIESLDMSPVSFNVPGSGSLAGDLLGYYDYGCDGDFICIAESVLGKFSSFFQQQSGNTSPALPRYIIAFLLMILLFKLFKK